MNTWFNNWVIWFDGFVHSIGFHFFTIPAIVLGILMILVAAVHWRNQKKRDKISKEKRQETLNTYLDKEAAA